MTACFVVNGGGFQQAPIIVIIGAVVFERHDVARQPYPKGDRVKIGVTAKFPLGNALARGCKKEWGA